MTTIVAGLQALILLVIGTTVVSNLTGMGGFASFIFGGLGACGIFGIIFVFIPRIMLVLTSGFWAISGYGLGDSMFGDIASSIAGAVVLGGLGFVVNYGLMQDSLTSYHEGQRLAGGPVQSTRSDVPSMTNEQADQMEAIWRGLYVLKGIGAVKLSTFSPLDKKFSQLFGMSGSEALGNVNNANPSTDEVMTSLMQLSDSDFLSKDELNVIEGRVEEWFEKPVSIAARPATPPVETADGALDKNEEALLAANLFRLAENRAIGLHTFSRLQQRLDPTYDISRVRPEVFPYLDEADQGDLETVESLFKASLIDRAEYQRAMQVILPHLSETKRSFH